MCSLPYARRAGLGRWRRETRSGTFLHSRLHPILALVHQCPQNGRKVTDRGSSMEFGTETTGCWRACCRLRARQAVARAQLPAISRFTRSCPQPWRGQSPQCCLHRVVWQWRVQPPGLSQLPSAARTAYRSLKKASALKADAAPQAMTAKHPSQPDAPGLPGTLPFTTMAPFSASTISTCKGRGGWRRLEEEGGKQGRERALAAAHV